MRTSAASDRRGSPFGTVLTREQIDALSDDPDEMRAAAAGHGRPGRRHPGRQLRGRAAAAEVADPDDPHLARCVRGREPLRRRHLPSTSSRSPASARCVASVNTAAARRVDDGTQPVRAERRGRSGRRTTSFNLSGIADPREDVVQPQRRRQSRPSTRRTSTRRCSPGRGPRRWRCAVRATTCSVSVHARSRADAGPDAALRLQPVRDVDTGTSASATSTCPSAPTGRSR